MKINRKTRTQLQKTVRDILKPNYFEDIPLTEIFDALKEHNCIVVQEDGEPWQGFLCGEEGDALFRFNYEGELCDNACLALQWYKMHSGKWETTGYIS